jgi:hypothetical protein
MSDAMRLHITEEIAREILYSNPNLPQTQHWDLGEAKASFYISNLGDLCCSVSFIGCGRICIAYDNPQRVHITTSLGPRCYMMLNKDVMTRTPWM